MKKKQTFYIDEKFNRKFGFENKSKIVNDALKKYFTDERDKEKNYLYILADLKMEIEKNNKKIDLLAQMINLNFKMTTLSTYSTDLIKEQNDQEAIMEKIEKIRQAYKNLTNT